MEFQPFDQQKPVQIYFTSMPHWRQEGCIYFVTYRLADSIPEKVIVEWDFEKLKWIQARIQSSRNSDRWHDLFPLLSAKDKYAFLKCFNRKLNTYLDGCHGKCPLRNPERAAVVLQGWEYFNSQRYELGDLVVMPNHVHVLVKPKTGFKLEDILRSQKRYSARECNRLSHTSGALWQKHSYDHIVRDSKELLAFQQYIASNPLKANLRDGEFLLRKHNWKLPT